MKRLDNLIRFIILKFHFCDLIQLQEAFFESTEVNNNYTYNNINKLKN